MIFPAITLIVDGAQMFGLGRSISLGMRVDVDKQTPSLLSGIAFYSHIARERMQIILELDYLGAGFKVAMEDLRVRGTGNILGEVQSGHMTRVKP